MLKSDQTAEIFAAFVKAQADLGAAHKDARNPHFKSTYATLESVIDAAKPVLAKHGLGFMQHCGPRDAQGVTVTTMLVHSSGQFIGDSLTLPMVKADPQSAGSAITYARRYALMAMLGLPATDDDAEQATHRGPVDPAPERPAPTKPPSATLMHAKEQAAANTTRHELRAWMTDRKDGLKQVLDAAEWVQFQQYVAKELAPTLPENDQEDAA